MPKAAFVYHPDLSRHVLREDHPMKPRRLQLSYELLEAYGAFGQPNALLVPPRMATEEELLLAHDQEYIRAVQRISAGEAEEDLTRYGFSPWGDNPPYPGMYEAACLSTGASLVAAELLLSGTVPTAFSISGGLHHAARGRASGFCVFNDPAVAIASLVQQGLRVAYVDIDAHHGDGVQQAFYESDDVLTISLHEWGRYLFPGTGETGEIGSGAGTGYAVNVPLFPYTGDEVYVWAFQQVAPPLLAAFRPDVLVAQLGVDAHYTDSLAHLQLTTAAYYTVVEQLLGAAPRVLCLGGGGYDLGAVARVWTLEYGLMLGATWPDQTPQGYRERYGVAQLGDGAPPELEESTVRQTRAFAERVVEDLRHTVFPLHGL
ncbi:MAG: acetoin utilization protein AcuC [Chloroflexi bacterium]|nr:acetoin utilization protein AcuC [Chloroflexota bacterium]